MTNITVEINGTVYRFPELDFNAVCDLQESGVDVLNPKAMKRKPITIARAILAWVMDEDLETAGREIQRHVINGGDVSAIFDGFFKAVEESGFMKSLSAKANAGREEKTVELQDHKRKQRTRKEQAETE